MKYLYNVLQIYMKIKMNLSSFFPWFTFYCVTSFSYTNYALEQPAVRASKWRRFRGFRICLSQKIVFRSAPKYRTWMNFSILVDQRTDNFYFSCHFFPDASNTYKSKKSWKNFTFLLVLDFEQKMASEIKIVRSLIYQYAKIHSCPILWRAAANKNITSTNTISPILLRDAIYLSQKQQLRWSAI